MFIHSTLYNDYCLDMYINCREYVEQNGGEKMIQKYFKRCYLHGKKLFNEVGNQPRIYNYDHTIINLHYDTCLVNTRPGITSLN